jgi:starch phosphorylase
MSPQQRTKTVPRVTIFGGKAAPGYHTAKLIIKFINQIGSIINNDPDINNYFKVVFIPNYNVSNAELIIPASDLSQHISTAGTEASGTSNMKFAMNGCLIIGTWDGANIEISEEIKEENMFMFGTTTEQVEEKRQAVRARKLPLPADLYEVMQAIRSGTFGASGEFHDLVDSLENGNDHYILSVDWEHYQKAQRKVDTKYQNQSSWIASSILSSAGCGKFSTDRTMLQYAEEIWKIKPCPRPTPSRKLK